MTEIKISTVWKNRIIRWLRDFIFIFTMWTIWLTRVYLGIEFYANVITGFQITIIFITIISEEYYDYKILELDEELKRLKK